jgi:hypothetical protein
MLSLLSLTALAGVASALPHTNSLVGKRSVSGIPYSDNTLPFVTQVPRPAALQAQLSQKIRQLWEYDGDVVPLEATGGGVS